MSRQGIDPAWMAKMLALAKRADELQARQVEKLEQAHRAQISSVLDSVDAVPELRAQIHAIQARVSGRGRVSEAEKLRACGFSEVEPEQSRSQTIKARHRARFGG